MKTLSIFTTLVAALMITSSCSNDQDSPAGIDVSNTPIKFITNVSNPGTRAGHTTSALEAGSFGLYIETSNTLIDDTRFNTANRKMTYTDGAWVAPEGATQLLWKDNTSAVNYTAYMPYDETIENKASYAISVEANQTSENIKAADFLFAQGATTGGESGENGIAIAFEHKLSLFKIVLKKGTELANEITFTSVTLTQCCGLTTTINLNNGTVASFSGVQDQTISLLNSDESTFECILVPQTFDNWLTVDITASNGIVYRYNSNETLAFSSGNAYTLPLTVGRDKVESGEFTITAWVNQSGGDLETE